MTTQTIPAADIEGGNESAVLSALPVFLCANCGGVGSRPTHRPDCPLREQERAA